MNESDKPFKFKEEFDLIWNEIFRKLNPLASVENSYESYVEDWIYWEWNMIYNYSTINMEILVPKLKFSFKLDVDSDLNDSLLVIESNDRLHFISQLQQLRVTGQALETLNDKNENHLQFQKSILRKMKEFSETIANQFKPNIYHVKQMILGFLEKELISKQDLKAIELKLFPNGNSEMVNQEEENRTIENNISKISLNFEKAEKIENYDEKFLSIWKLIYEKLAKKSFTSLEQSFKDVWNLKTDHTFYPVDNLKCKFRSVEKVFRFQFDLHGKEENNRKWDPKNFQVFFQFHELQELISLHFTIQLLSKSNEKRQNYEALILANLEGYYKCLCEIKFPTPSQTKKELLKFFKSERIQDFFSEEQVQQMLQELLME